MKSTLKILVPLVVLVGVVFGVTLLTLYKQPDDTKTPGDGKDPDRSTGAAPLRFFTSTRQWEPTSENLSNRYFPGFFEKGTEAKTAFWFDNPNDRAVVVQLKGVSCSACSGGSLAPIPPEAVRNMLQMLAVTSLPLGLAPAPPVGMAGAWAHTRSTLEWQSHKFAATDWHFKVPAANPDDRWSRTQWGIMELNFSTGGKQSLDVTFGSQIVETSQYAEDKFVINFGVVNPFEVHPGAIDVGEFTETSRPQTPEFLVLSSTRGPGTALGELPPPACAIRMPGGAGDPGKLVTVEKPIPIPPDVCEALAEKLSPAGGAGKLKITSGYRVPVRITPEAGGDRLDIGLLEREIWVTVGVPGAAERQVRLRGVVRGGVWVSEGKEVVLGTFKGRRGQEKSVRLTTEKPGMDLAVVAGQCEPDFLDVALKKLPDDPDRGYYQLTVKVPPERKYGPIVNGLVVLEIKGPKPQRIRIPVTGNGEF